MKIAILNESSPYPFLSEQERQTYGIPIGHSHPWVRNLAEALARIPGNEVHVVGMTGNLPGDLHRQFNGVYYHFIHSTPLPIKAITIFESNAWKMKAFLHSLNLDIVNAHSFTRSGYFATRSGFPSVYTLHGVGLREWLKTSSEPWYQKYLMLHYEKVCRRVARYFIFVSKVLYEKRAYLHLQSRIWTIENAISLEYFRPSKIQQNNDFLFVGSLQLRKSPLDLLRALIEVPQARAGFIFQTAQPEYLAQMKKFIADNDLEERVDFWGGMDAAQISEILRQCRALVLTSYLETAPMVISEAMAVGKPVIATAVNGIPFMVEDGRTGLLYQPGNIEALTEHMRRLLEEPELARQMGTVGRQEAFLRWHPDNIAIQTMDAYQEVIRTWA